MSRVQRWAGHLSLALFLRSLSTALLCSAFPVCTLAPQTSELTEDGSPYVLEIESHESGLLRHILVGEGTEALPVGTPLAVFEDPDWCEGDRPRKEFLWQAYVMQGNVRSDGLIGAVGVVLLWIRPTLRRFGLGGALWFAGRSGAHINAPPCFLFMSRQEW